VWGNGDNKGDILFDDRKECCIPELNDQRLWIAWVQAYNYKALDLLMEMEKNGPQTNETTLICILSSCAHGGLVLKCC
jgi:pentatricopeptide repeat protein